MNPLKSHWKLHIQYIQNYNHNSVVLLSSFSFLFFLFLQILWKCVSGSLLNWPIENPSIPGWLTPPLPLCTPTQQVLTGQNNVEPVRPSSEEEEWLIPYSPSGVAMAAAVTQTNLWMQDSPSKAGKTTRSCHKRASYNQQVALRIQPSSSSIGEGQVSPVWWSSPGSIPMSLVCVWSGFWPKSSYTKKRASHCSAR